MSPRVRIALKAAVWAAALWPMGVLVRGYFADDLTANPIDYITRTLGLTALVLILASLGMTPLRIVFGWSWPIQLRRLLGLLAFFYVVVHFSVWIGLDHFFDWPRMWQDVRKRPFKRMGGANWRLLHKLAYVIGILGVLHFLWLSKKGRTTAYYYAITLAVLLGVRLWDWLRKRWRASVETARRPTAAREA